MSEDQKIEAGDIVEANHPSHLNGKQLEVLCIWEEDDSALVSDPSFGDIPSLDNVKFFKDRNPHPQIAEAFELAIKKDVPVRWVALRHLVIIKKVKSSGNIKYNIPDDDEDYKKAVKFFFGDLEVPHVNVNSGFKYI